MIDRCSIPISTREADPLERMIPLAKTLEQRFWEKVRKAGPLECWEWTGACDGAGYGRIYFEGKIVKAWEILFYLLTGVYPHGVVLSATCGNRRCCNIVHVLPHLKDNRPLEERFWACAKVLGPDDCWNWQSHRTPDGYGVFCNGKHGNVYAHRMAYILRYGEIPEGMCVLHKCDNPSCVNWSHLFLGTNRDNVVDMLWKGRSRAAKLTPDEVREIRSRAANGESCESLALEYGVTVRHVRSIIDGKHWKHMEDAG